MNSQKIENLMIPLADYATVSEDATLYEAVLALEESQKKFDANRHPQRAVLVLDARGYVVGKIGQTEVLRSLEPKYETFLARESLAHTGMTRAFMKSLMEKYNLWGGAMHDICKKAGAQHVRDFMHVPSDGETIDVEATLDHAIHQLIVGGYQSLLVRRKGDIVGILRLTDVFAAITASIKACAL